MFCGHGDDCLISVKAGNILSTGSPVGLRNKTLVPGSRFYKTVKSAFISESNMCVVSLHN